MALQNIILCIDLGTTFSVMAYIDETGKPVVIRNEENEKTTPSLVFVDDGEITVGRHAESQMLKNEEKVIKMIKRAMGQEDFTIIGMTPSEVSAEILKKLKRDAEMYLGQEISEAVITCPAYFGAKEVERTKEAGELAGFVVKEIIKEPTAAAVYWGMDNLEIGERVLVCDLGGGTYDACVVDCVESYEGKELRPQPSAGSRELGGYNWTYSLLEHVTGLFTGIFEENPCDDLTVKQMLFDACEKGKRDLSQVDEITINCSHKGRTESVTVSRETFDQLNEEKILEMIMLTDQALAKCTPVLAPEDDFKVLLCGGSTRLKRVAGALEDQYNKKPIETGSPDTMVALGAAAMAGAEIIVTRTNSRNLGTRVWSSSGEDAALENSVIIPMGEDITAGVQMTEEFLTSVQNMTTIDIPVVEFDDTGPDEVVNNWRFKAVPGTSKGSTIEVTYTYDPSGIIDVDAVDQKTGDILSKDRVAYEDPVKPSDQVEVETAIIGSIVFLLDVSYSMDDSDKIGRAKNAVIEQARNLMNDGQGQLKVGVVTFGGEARSVCPLTDSMNEVETAVSPIGLNGSTMMHLGIRMAVDLLQDKPEDQRRIIAMLTDGMPDDTGAALDAAREAEKYGFELVALGIGEGGQGEIDKEFIGMLTPVAEIIPKSGNIGAGLGNILMRKPKNTLTTEKTD